MKELYWRGGVPLLIALVTFLIPPPAGLTGQNWHLFGIFFAMIVGFITRPFPMGAVCIIGLCLISITKTLTPSEILVGFSSNAIWLIVMAFFFSRAFLKTGLGKRIAYRQPQPNSRLRLCSIRSCFMFDHPFFSSSSGRNFVPYYSFR